MPTALCFTFNVRVGGGEGHRGGVDVIWINIPYSTCSYLPARKHDLWFKSSFSVPFPLLPPPCSTCERPTFNIMFKGALGHPPT